MIISDLNHLETVAEPLSIVGGRSSSSQVKIKVISKISQRSIATAQAIGTGASTGTTVATNLALQLINLRDNNAGSFDLGNLLRIST